MTLAAPSDSVVKVCSPERVTLPSGGESPARISVVVADGIHVQADPASLEFLFPLRLKIRAKGGVRAKTPMYPPGQAYHLEGMPIDLMTYAGTFEILVTFQAGESARPGDNTLRGVLHFQACDERSCRFPASVPVSVPVRVVPEAVPEA